MLSAKVEMCFKTRPLVCSFPFEGLVSELRSRDGVTQGACVHDFQSRDKRQSSLSEQKEEKRMKLNSVKFLGECLFHQRGCRLFVSYSNMAAMSSHENYKYPLS